jgi:predicted nucleic acid-binding protein
MTRTLVDSSVLIDFLSGDPLWGPRSLRALQQAADDGGLVINPIIYAEVSVGYADPAEIDRLAPPDLFAREDLPWEAAFLAGKAVRASRRAGGATLSPLPDFYIRAHAAVRGYRWLTRDPRRIAAYFPGVEIVAPG